MLKYTWMQLKQKITSLLKIIQKLPLWITIPVVALFVVLLSCLVLFFREKTVSFSYNSDNCVRQTIFLPNLSKLTAGGSEFTVKNDNLVKIGDLQLFSRKTCLYAKKAPTVGTTRLSIAMLGGWFGKKTVKLVVPQPPVAQLEILSQPLPTLKPLEIPLNMADFVFDYQFKIDNGAAPCPIKDKSIYCDIKSLNLLQGSSYDIKLVRMFNDKEISTLASKTINTLAATTVVGSSISQNQIVYDKPKTFTFDFDKEVVKSNIILEKIESSKRTTVTTTVVHKDKRATITVVDDLERNMSYEFSIDQLESRDGSTLAEPYKLDFATSDGPSIVDVSVGSTGAPLSGTIVLTFDQGLSNDQNIADFVSVTGVPASIWKSGNKLYIKYANASICSGIGIHINQGLISNNGVNQDDSWQFSTRTICYTTLVIGNSVGGRPILAYMFGSGGTTILFTGGIHGSEPSGSYLMHDWISYLDSNAEKIPADKKIVVVPDVNPDGLAASSRYNLNNVNIDRNFPSANWTADIDSSSGLVVGGGGTSAMSEPETKALADLTTTLQPRLEVSFHAQGRLVGANQRGDSVDIGNMYASSVGYNSMIGHAEETMGYTMTGEYEEWAGEQYGTPAILIELPTSTGRYFWAHQSILWKIINI